MQGLFEKYRQTRTKFCIGCLHTEDETKLYSLNNSYGYTVFSSIFSNLYTIEDIIDFSICSWCTRRIKNAQELFNNFECAKKTLAKLRHNSSSNISTDNILDTDLLSEINDLKIKSRPTFKTVLDTDNFVHNIYPHKYDDEISDAKFEDRFSKEFKLKLNVAPRDPHIAKYRKVKKHNSFKKNKSSASERRKSKSKHGSMSTNKDTMKFRDEINGVNVRKHMNKDTCKKSDSLMQGFRNLNDEIMAEEVSRSQENDKPMELTEKSIVLEIDKISMGVNDLHFNVDTKHIESLVDEISIVKIGGEIKKKIVYSVVETRQLREASNLFTKYKVLNRNSYFTCLLCDRIFAPFLHLLTHIARDHVHKKILFECVICKYSKQKHVKILAHLKRHKKDLISNDLDIYIKMYDVSDIETHLAIDCQSGDNICYYCKINFETRMERSIHMEEEHMLAVRIFPCPYCKTELYNTDDLSHHMEMKHSHACSFCQKRFAGMAVVREHEDRVHKKVPALQKQCHLCDKVFSSMKSLKKHQVVHIGETRHKCDVCTLTFRRCSSLNSHKLHTHNIDTSIPERDRP